jgi:uncharacterized integral membrane protein (TIGR00698 family)
MVSRDFKHFLGIIILCLGALLSRVLSSVIGINELLLAIGLGVILTNTVGIPNPVHSGIKTHKTWLAAGIVLLGASLTISAILEIGIIVLFLMIGIVALTLLSVEFIAQNVYGLTEKFGSLLAVGTSICGVSAIVAVGGAIRAKETQIAYAAGVVLLIDSITIVVYPIIGSLLDLSATVFGVWAGISMLSTGPAVAVGFTHSETAGQWATMTKLARNTLIGAITIGYASYYTHRGSRNRASLNILWKKFPKFVLGFLALVVLTSLGAFSPDQQTSIGNAVNWLFLLAFVGLGTEIQISDFRQIGVAPVLVVLLSMFIASALSLILLLNIL